MSWLESIYCYTQHERMQEGKGLTYSSQNGNLMLTFILLILIYGTLYLAITIFPEIIDALSDVEKTIGQVVVAISIALIYPIVAKTIGKQENFERITELFYKMSVEEQAKISKKGKLFFSLSMFYFPFVAFVSWLIG